MVFSYEDLRETEKKVAQSCVNVSVCVSACLCVCVHVCIYLCSLVPDYALGERLRERGRIQVAMET